MEKMEESDGALTFSHKNIKNYICEWTNSHGTSTEHHKKTSDSWKGQNTST